MVRLLTLVPYLHARGSVRVDEAAADLGVTPAQLVSDLKVLFMCGLPGGYPDDLIDVDLDALEGEEGDGVIRVSNADYLARPLQLSPTEATALIVALRAMRNGAADDTREVVDRTLAKLEAAAAGRFDPRLDPGAEPERRPGARSTARARAGRRRAAPGPADLLRPVPRRGVRAGGRPARRRHRARLHLPRRLLPQRRGATPVPARPDPGRDGARHADPDPRRGAARPGRRDSSTGRRTPRPRRCGSPRRRAGSSSTTPSRTCASARTAV